MSTAFRPLSARRPSASTRRLPAAAGSNVLEIYFCLSILENYRKEREQAGQFVQVLNFCKQGNSLVGQFVHVLHFFVARLKQYGTVRNEDESTHWKRERNRESE